MTATPPLTPAQSADQPATAQPTGQSWRARRSALLGMAALSLIPLSATTMAASESDAQREMEKLFEVFAIAKQYYVEPVSDQKLVEGAIDGMLKSLDAHSSYLPAREYKNFRTQMQGEYGGLGLSVTMEDSVVKVISPQAGTPAALAGIKPGDYITHLDGELVVGMKLDEAVEKMRGKPGTPIKLSIVRQGRDKPFDVSVTRALIDVPTATWKNHGNITVLTLTSFSEDATKEMKAAFKAAEKAMGRRPAGYVLDLRSNPGGSRDEAVSISDMFLNAGEIVSERGRQFDNRFAAESMIDGDLTGGAPVIVLIDQGSASASEIVAGALQDHRRALVMGERSFGKGSVQSMLEGRGGGGIKLTVARYYTPNGRSVQEGGITPDIRVPQLSDPDYASRPSFRESDLRRHLVNEAKVDPKLLDNDAKVDPRFTATAEQLKKQGIEDFQMHYALETMTRLERGAPSLAAAADAAAKVGTAPAGAAPAKTGGKR